MNADELRALRDETQERLDDAVADQRSMAMIMRLRKTVIALDQAASDRAALERVREWCTLWPEWAVPGLREIVGDAALRDEQEGDTSG